MKAEPKTVWLIEVGPASAPLYVYFHEGMPAWTFSANHACPFLTRDAAASAAGLLDNPKEARIAEHILDQTA